MTDCTDDWKHTGFDLETSIKYSLAVIHTQDFGFKKRMLLGQETIAPMSLSGSFSDLS